MNKYILYLLLATGTAPAALAQERPVHAHAHNDYLHPVPFYTSYARRVASIEVDVFLVGDDLLVAHDAATIDTARSFDRLYLRPLLEQIEKNGGKAYPGGEPLQLLVDLKSEGEATLRCLARKLAPHRRHFDARVNPGAVRVVISGNAPPPERFADHDPLFFFDGSPRVRYTPAQAARVALCSAPLRAFTAWNGLGRIPAPEYRTVTAFVDSVHALGKPARFWGNPDTKTLWQAFIKIGVDYINTDRPDELATFLERRERQSYRAEGRRHAVVAPAKERDGRPRNVILLISDGAGFSHLWAAATANGGALNVTRCTNAGFLQTTPFDDYNTDSAAAGTAIATGAKTRNRYIGVDPDGRRLVNLPEALAARGIASGILTNDNVTGATPAAFYAHRQERNMSDSIALDLLSSPAAVVVGGFPRAFAREDSALTRAARQEGFVVLHDAAALDAVPHGQRVICLDGDDLARGYRLIEEAFDACTRRLATNRKGFFLVVEGAKIDSGGHGNNLATCIDEYLSFDRVVGQALRFAEADGETLVIVTSDHETGGLTIIDGDYQQGTLLGDFATSDHTGTPVPLFAYGPGATAFRGFVQNSDLFAKIMQCIK
jgi:alkaline phosphatase